MALRAGAKHVTAVERWLYLSLATKQSLVANGAQSLMQVIKGTLTVLTPCTPCLTIFANVHTGGGMQTLLLCVYRHGALITSNSVFLERQRPEARLPRGHPRPKNPKTLTHTGVPDDRAAVVYKRPTDLALLKDLAVCCNLLVCDIMDDGAHGFLCYPDTPTVPACQRHEPHLSCARCCEACIMQGE